MPDVVLIDRDGAEIQVADTEAAQLLARPDNRWRVRNEADVAQRVSKEALDDRYGDTAGKIKAGAAAVARGLTLGASDVALRAIGVGDDVRNLQQANPTISTVGELGGALLTAIPTGGTSLLARAPAAIAGRVGSAIAHAGEGASVATRVGRAALGGAVEGGLYGLGSGISEVALSDKPVDLERAVSTISSHMLFGGGIGGAAGSLGKVAEIGLQKGKAAVDDIIAARARANVTDDLAAMDAKGLRAAREAELDAIKTAHKAETEALEAARVTERQAIADDIAALRRQVKDDKHFLTTKDVHLDAVEGKASVAELGRIGAKAEKQLAGLLDNPIGLAKNPAKALDALQRQEHAMVALLERGDELRAAYALEKAPDRVIGGVKMPAFRDSSRAAALDTVAGALERNRAIQARIAEVTKPHAPVPTSSARLNAIDAAREALQGGAGKGGLPEQLLQGAAFSAITGAVASSDLPGAGMAAPLLGAAGSKFIADKVFGRLGKATSEATERGARAVSRFLDPAAKATKAAVPIATKVFSTVRFAADREPAPSTPPKRGQGLEALFRARSEEVRSQTYYAPDGSVQMRPDARAQLAERLKPIAAANPRLADQLETIAARRIEFLASKLPRRPELGGMQLAQPHWSDMEMRQWARYVAGVENPTGIIERLADASVSPEDAEVMRAVYPEMLADLTRQIVEQLPTLQRTLPYKRRLALTVLTGVTVDPSTDPKILSVLQRFHTAEEGTAGGTMAPKAKPQFGSVSKPEPTAAQKRSA